MTEGRSIDEADEWQSMTHQDFAIGREFETATGAWRCTDVGTRTVAAIEVSDHRDDPSRFNGLPYAVAEVVLEERDFVECWPVGSAEGRDPKESGTTTPTRPRAPGGALKAAARKTASDLEGAGVMAARNLEQLRATTDDASDGIDATRVLYVNGVAEPAARLGLMVGGVEIAFLAERPTGFVA